MRHQGSCHCGKVTFEVEGTPTEVNECNCSHCSRKGFQLWFVPRGQFTLKSGESELTPYLFNKRHIQHTFCKTCGTEAFEFDRTTSRLMEMQSRDWLDDWALRHAPAQPQEAGKSLTA